MFHTFESSKLNQNAQLRRDATETKPASSRRTSTVRACEPCRKRKIRCSGELPCETCQWYRKTNSCHYTEPRQRQMPSRKAVEDITSTLQDYRKILQQLFPTTPPDALTDLPRETLLDLVYKNASRQPPSPAMSSGGVVETNNISPQAEAGGLETLQTMPEETMDTSDASQTNPGIADEVNALSLSVKVASSYQGISSVMAVLRVILWIYPESQTFFSGSPDRTAISSRAQTPPPKEGVFTGKAGLFLLNSYFQFVHPLIPLLEEQSFRETYHLGVRHDSRWLALLNMVFAMGSMAASDADDKNHFAYFERAKQHLGGLECLGSAHLETVQTLAIMGGFYLHYLQSPNLANSVMGACLRMALSLGLHREYVDARPKATPVNPAFSADMRRRVWWSIFVLDSWANMTLGRPSMRDSPAITANPPLYVDDRGQGLAILCLIHNIKFAKIATQIEDALAITPLVPNPEMCALDTALVEWQNQLPQALQPDSMHGSSESILSTCSIMRWRYQITRVVLHRPVLLNYAMRRIPFSQLREEEQDAVEKCRAIARELIADIAANRRPNQMCCWNGLWFLYNASLVPLLSLFSDPHDPENVELSRDSVELALQTMTEIMHYSPTGKRSIDAASRIYEASKRLIADTRSIIEKSAAASKRARKASNNKGAAPKRATTISTTTTSQPDKTHQTQHSQHPSYSPNGTTLLTPQPPPEPLSSTSTDFFTHFQNPSPDSTSSTFQAYNPTNLPQDSGTTAIDIQTMWDSLNWASGFEPFEFSLDSHMTCGFGWPENADAVFPVGFEVGFGDGAADGGGGGGVDHGEFGDGFWHGEGGEDEREDGRDGAGAAGGGGDQTEEAVGRWR